MCPLPLGRDLRLGDSRPLTCIPTLNAAFVKPDLLLSSPVVDLSSASGLRDSSRGDSLQEGRDSHGVHCIGISLATQAIQLQNPLGSQLIAKYEPSGAVRVPSKSMW